MQGISVNTIEYEASRQQRRENRPNHQKVGRTRIRSKDCQTPIKARNVSPSLILHRLGSYARRNRIHQALCEIGRVYKTAFILTYLNDEPLRHRMGRELNKGEGSHDLSRFLCFGKEGTLRGREFEDQVHTFSCLSLLHNAVVGWNIRQMGLLIEQLRQEGHTIRDEDIQRIAPLMWRHINPFGQYHFDLTRMRRVS